MFSVLQARDIYEEAIVSVNTVRDFTQIFDAYANFAERETRSKMDELENFPGDEEKKLELELLFARMGDYSESQNLIPFIL
ncbi:unnamed protein product [Gongylonema pulchrum]|uniref:Epsilon-coat protein n=1 Tax=Gongylonema pulchrum TaxID=637853 RepID=A0A183ECH0_9BILA|nr:unnamed protein product [Gongylonema pulchrum]